MPVAKLGFLAARPITLGTVVRFILLNILSEMFEGLFSHFEASFYQAVS